MDLEAISTLVTDVDMEKETKPSFYLKHILPIILKNQVVHFVGFGNRLAFDPIAFELQNTSSLCFVGPLDPYLVGPFAKSMKVKSEGLCPLTPEESIIMLGALGFNRKTHIFVAGSNL